MKRSKLAIHAPRDKPKKRRGIHKKSKNKSEKRMAKKTTLQGPR